MMLASRKKDLKRLNDSLRKNSDKGKKIRKQLRSKKKGYEDKDRVEEGEVYSSRES